MGMLETAIIVVHVLISLALVALILLQQGKGAEAGASFGGGASQTVFGSQGSGNFLSRATSWLAVVFFVTSIALALVAKQKAEVAASGEEIVVPVEQQEGSTLFEEPKFGDDGEPVEYNQSFEEMKQSLEAGVVEGDAGFAAPREGQEAVPELE